MNLDKFKELQAKLDELQKQLDELKKPKSLTRWRAKEDEDYLSTKMHGGIMRSSEEMTSVDDIRHNHGNYFPLELKGHLESETLMEIRFIQQMTVICWQLEPDRMGKAYDMGTNYDMGDYGHRRIRDTKDNLLSMFNFTTQELASQAWEMLSEDVREWLKK